VSAKFGLRSIYLTEAEWSTYQAAAQAAGSTTNTWIRNHLAEAATREADSGTQEGALERIELLEWQLKHARVAQLGMPP
jgi:aspartyl/asparaginyl beta-hydroxylase (cupin superfamily)